MTSIVSIGNLALIALGNASLIESLSENSVEAKLINELYDQSRKQTLEAFDWSFARKRLVLSTHADDPPDGVWAYRYQYPADCLAFRRIENPMGEEADAIPFTVEPGDDGTTKSILTDLNEAKGIYTFDQELVDLFSSHYVDTLAYSLAYKIAIPLTGSRALQSDMIQLYGAMIRAAPAVDTKEEQKDAPRDTDWIRGRE